jgi:SAM-dependent methyltransferase
VSNTESSWSDYGPIVRESLRLLGFWMTLRYLLIYLLSYKAANDRSFDRRYGTETTGLVPISKLNIADAQTMRQANIFLGSPARISRRMIESLQVDVPDFTFVDYGSGKGRSTLVAAEYPFRKVIGVEISGDLHAAALANRRQFMQRVPDAAEIEFRCMDAREFQLPAGDLILHMYHPFGQDLLREVLTSIRSQAAGEQRTILIPYLFSVAMAKAVFDEFPEFHCRRDVLCVNNQYRWTLYEI